MPHVLGLVLFLFMSLGDVATPRVYDFELFTYDEVNKLRQRKPKDRMKIYQKVYDRYSRNISNAVKMRNYTKALKLSDEYTRVLDYILDDIAICAEDPDNRNNKRLRQCEVGFRKNLQKVRGAAKALPYRYQDDMEQLIIKLKYCRTILFRFINEVDEEKP